MQNPSLNSLGIRYNTDKSSAGRLNHENGRLEEGKSYLYAYQHILTSCYRAFTTSNSNRSFKLLELGAGPQWNQGASIKTFQAFLPKDSEIYVVDISTESLAPLDGIENITTICTDLSEDKAYSQILQHGPFDFIIDDASHNWKHQIDALSWLWPALSPWGVFIVEDIHTSFGHDRQHHNSQGLPSNQDFYWSVLSLLTSYVGRSRFHPVQDSLPNQPFGPNIIPHLASICFIPSAVILQKGSNSYPYLNNH